METDIGNPIDYNPTIDPLAQDKEEDTSKIDEQQYYFQSPEMNYQQPLQPEKTDIFANIEKSTWIIAFAVFLLGFFMGKTMQPVILRYT
ncbi:hypothetical protein FK873_gp014 [Micromonas pusilla virus SP1]|jgi:hypothetical protein|uniref:Uncharacterized protein n=1 Tax=Micromonas pusilla virus SP1 TaxID=373996 RepID=G9E5Y5_MPSP1|nr:hypothetical protein FK873_gp014 [Micromonas pusilla virus SP1]AET84812.1 hypothetical protein MPXG_00014 [Micromonas pusilla virus SP1]